MEVDRNEYVTAIMNLPVGVNGKTTKDQIFRDKALWSLENKNRDAHSFDKALTKAFI